MLNLTLKKDIAMSNGQHIFDTNQLFRKVVGYISSEKTQYFLSGCGVGTFLLRFSITTPNAITIDWFQEGRLFCG
jgi:hypothetical protein